MIFSAPMLTRSTFIRFAARGNFAGTSLTACDMRVRLGRDRLVEGLFVAIFNFRGVEAASHPVDDVKRKLPHLLRQAQVFDMPEAGCAVTYFVRVAQRHREHPFAEWLDQHRMLTPRQHDARQSCRESFRYLFQIARAIGLAPPSMAQGVRQPFVPRRCARQGRRATVSRSSPRGSRFRRRPFRTYRRRASSSRTSQRPRNARPLCWY